MSAAISPIVTVVLLAMTAWTLWTADHPTKRQKRKEIADFNRKYMGSGRTQLVDIDYKNLRRYMREVRSKRG